MDVWVEAPPTPLELTLSWRAPEEVEDRTRWAIGLLSARTPTPTFRYFEGEEFRKLNLSRDHAQLEKLGYRGYPAFGSTRHRGPEFSEDVMAAFLRRLPPPTRSDFPSYLELFRYRGAPLPAMTLLALTAARLPSDGFALIDRLDPNAAACDIVVEIAGYRHQPSDKAAVIEGTKLELVPEPDNPADPNAVRLMTNGIKVGYVNRLQAETVLTWLATRSLACWLIRKNGRAHSPTAYALLRMRPREKSLAA